jgi:hypothetical protein
MTDASATASSTATSVAAPATIEATRRQRRAAAFAFIGPGACRFKVFLSLPAAPSLPEL